MSDGIKLEIKTGNLMSMMGAGLSGESLMKCVYTNNTSKPGYVAITGDIPGVLVPINMRTTTTLKCKRGAWVCSTGSLETSIAADFNRPNSLGACCFSGIDFVVQTLSGGSWSFLGAMGTVIARTLVQGEEILVDTNSILAFDESVTIDVRAVGGCGAMCCAGEGAFNTLMRGPGKIYLQSMPIEKLRSLFPKPPDQKEGGAGGGGGGGGE